MLARARFDSSLACPRARFDLMRARACARFDCVLAMLLARALPLLPLLLVLAASAARAQPARAPFSVLPAACADSDADCYRDGAGRARSARAAYRVLHAPTEPHHLRAIAEDFVYLAVGTTWYWVARDKNLVDWDRPSAKARFTLDVIRFDNNEFPINFTLHPWSGAAYYTAARTNGVSFAGSAGYALAATLAWEYGIEFREKVSLNDLIFTPLAGIALGEFASRLALYVNRPARPITPLQRAAGIVFGPLQAFADAFDAGPVPTGGPADRLGYSADVFHRFELRLGTGLQVTPESEQWLWEFGVDAAFVAIPAYARPGRFRGFVHDADFTRFWLTHVQGGDEREFDNYADVSLLGVYEQSIDQGLRGGSVFLGTTLGYRYRRSLFTDFRDEVSATHLPGFACEAMLVAPGVAFRLSYRLHPDFAGVRSLAYEAWQAANPEALGKTTLASHGYLYAFGVTSLLELTLDLRGLRLGARSWFAYYDSKEGLDRKQEELTADPKGFERVLDAEGFVRVRPIPRWPLALELALLSRQRRSQLAGFQGRAELLRATLRLALQF
jgi:hypothetical protein